MHKRALLFDLDGVLIPSERAMARAAQKAYREYGIETRCEDFVAHAGEGDDRYFAAVAQQYDREFDPAMKARAYEYYTTYAPEAARGVARRGRALLLNLRRDYPINLCSEAGSARVDINLDALGLSRGFFDSVTLGSEVSHGKPAPDLYQLAARRMGIAPARCAVVEDTPCGLTAARAAGMTSVALVGTFPASRLKDAPHDYMLASLVELVDALPP